MSKRSPDKGPRQPMARMSSLRHRGNSRTTHTGGFERLDAEKQFPLSTGWGSEIAAAAPQNASVGQESYGQNEFQRSGITSVGAAVAAAVTEMVLSVGDDLDSAIIGSAEPVMGAADAPNGFQAIKKTADGAFALDPKSDSNFLETWRNAVRAYLGPEEFEAFCLSMRQRAHDKPPS